MEDSRVKVSVLIPSYNYARYLNEAIESVLNQTYENFELIIVDNCSTDETVELVNEYMNKDPRIKLHVNETNIGMFRNYNQALLLAQGEYIKFLNADDKLDSKTLEVFVDILDNKSNISLVTSYRQNFQANSKIDKQDFHGQHNGREMILHALSKINFIGEPTTVMFRRKNLNLGLFDTSLLFFADLDMWLRQLSVGDLYIVNDILSYVRKHELQGTNTLQKNIDQSVFISFQWAEYVRNAILMNRFGYNLYEGNYQEIKQILKKSSKIPHRLLFVKSTNRQRLRDYFSSINILTYFRYFIKNIFRKKNEY
ncbi:glycosyltransferase family 2 protein [Sulfurimonas sp.]